MRLTIFVLSIAMFLPSVTGGSEIRNRLWLLWEQFEPQSSTCDNNQNCSTNRKFITRLLDTPNLSEIHRTIGALDHQALLQGRPIEHPDAPRICQNRDPELLLGFEPESWETSDKLAALKDLPGVYFSINRLSAPEGYAGDFGPSLQNEFERRFRAAGIRVLSESEMNKAPGKPQLNVYFSRANRVTGCRYSIFASLSQTMLLTRNINVKLKVGTWGLSEGPSDKYPDQHEYDAILRVADAFVSSYLEANSDNYVAQR